MRGREVCLPGEQLPTRDCSPVVCFNVASNPSFVDTFNPVTLAHSNSSEGHRAVAVPLVLTTPSRLHLRDQGQTWRIQSLNLPILESVVLLVQRTAHGEADISGKGYNPMGEAASTHESEAQGHTTRQVLCRHLWD